ncbi:uncharacterized protein LOC127242855 [Andrographis paniculata]|uniref:uncharacterized protein LOC127242855 n=1 Tax=Andrographis paniculata TaxID=175694 RepID=UPI0021E8A8D1|nr:uncharacterized protein LOC127242855 [Andrographis paniculata]
MSHLSMAVVKPVKYCVVDAFTDSAFGGNPAAVCLLEEDRGDEWLQAVARELNQPVTCFLMRFSDSAGSSAASVPRFFIRWFTRLAEVSICGHATLAASLFIFESKLMKSEVVEFSSPSYGTLTAKRIAAAESSPDLSKRSSHGDFDIELDFPAFSLKGLHNDDAIEVSSVSKSLNGASAMEILVSSRDIFCVVPSGEEVAEVVPNFDEIRKFSERYRGMIVTGIAPAGSGFDIISRFFCPNEGVNEDQVCGSAHCAIAPYWSKKLRKSDLVAYQASERGGVLNLHVDDKNQRVLIRGKGIVVMEGFLFV